MERGEAGLADRVGELGVGLGGGNLGLEHLERDGARGGSFQVDETDVRDIGAGEERAHEVERLGALGERERDEQVRDGTDIVAAGARIREDVDRRALHALPDHAHLSEDLVHGGVRGDREQERVHGDLVGHLLERREVESRHLFEREDLVLEDVARVGGDVERVHLAHQVDAHVGGDVGEPAEALFDLLVRAGGVPAGADVGPEGRALDGKALEVEDPAPFERGDGHAHLGGDLLAVPDLRLLAAAVRLDLAADAALDLGGELGQDRARLLQRLRRNEARLELRVADEEVGGQADGASGDAARRLEHRRKRLREEELRDVGRSLGDDRGLDLLHRETHVGHVAERVEGPCHDRGGRERRERRVRLEHARAEARLELAADAGLDRLGLAGGSAGRPARQHGEHVPVRLRGEEGRDGAVAVDRLRVQVEKEQDVVELPHVVLLAHAEREGDSEAVRGAVERQGRVRIVREIAVGTLEKHRLLPLRRRDQTLALLGGTETDIARENGLRVHDVAVGDGLAHVHRRVVHVAARLREAGAHQRGVARVDLGVRADRAGADVLVDRVLVAVEDDANLLARERTDAARHESGVRRAAWREAELEADAVDLVRRDAALRESAHEGVLDREDLGVGERHIVLAGPVHEVVDLAKRGRAREIHLPGIVLSGRDLLELPQRDVDVCEVDWHFGSPC